MKHGWSEPMEEKMNDSESLPTFPSIPPESGASMETSSTENDVFPSHMVTSPQNKTFVRCRSIDLDDIGLYQSINNTPISKPSSPSERKLDTHFNFNECEYRMYNSSPIDQANCDDTFKSEIQPEEKTNNSTVINMIKNASEKSRKKKLPNLELTLINGPLENLHQIETKQFLEPNENTSNLQPLPNSELDETTPSTATTMYSNLFANVGKCVMMPIDKDYETKYLLMNKMNGINGVNSFFPPGMKRRHEKTMQEHTYLFLEHPSGYICFFYHMFV
jgi:hypothetical protein